jgi:hypothetical protein
MLSVSPGLAVALVLGYPVQQVTLFHKYIE